MVHVGVLPNRHIVDVNVRNGLSDGVNHPVTLRGRPPEAVPGDYRGTAEEARHSQQEEEEDHPELLCWGRSRDNKERRDKVR